MVGVAVRFEHLFMFCFVKGMVFIRYGSLFFWNIDSGLSNEINQLTSSLIYNILSGTSNEVNIYIYMCVYMLSYPPSTTTDFPSYLLSFFPYWILSFSLCLPLFLIIYIFLGIGYYIN
jgi:hypothetical protein